MIKKLKAVDDIPTSEETLAQAKQMLKDLYPCFVLITCTEPSHDGKMNVEMDFEGDEDLASMITENATQIFEGRSTAHKK